MKMKRLLMMLFAVLMVKTIEAQENTNTKTKAQEKGEKVGKGVADWLKGVEDGVDKSAIKVDIKPDEKLLEYLEFGRTAKTDSSGVKVVSIYVICKKNLNSKVVLKAYDADKKEMGRKSLDVNIKEDETNFLNFKFDSKTPIDLATYYVLELK